MGNKSCYEISMFVASALLCFAEKQTFATSNHNYSLAVTAPFLQMACCFLFLSKAHFTYP